MVLHLGLGFHLKLLKSPMDYFKINLNMGIAFNVRYSYDFTIPTNVLTFIDSKNWHYFFQ